MNAAVAGTFSCVARDAATGELGVAVQSKFFAVGAVVPWLRAGVGAVATQSWANVAYGPEALRRMAAEAPAHEVLEHLVASDPGRDVRQVGIVDRRGRSAAHTGTRCLPWAGHRTGEGWACLGNILAGERVVAGMADAYCGASGRLPERLLAALQAGQAEGGDRRGMQSAALIVVRESGGFGGRNDRYLDLRVDDDPVPIEELARLLRVFRASPYDPDFTGTIPLAGDVVTIAQAVLTNLGLYAGPVDGRASPPLWNALEKFHERYGFAAEWLGGEALSRRAHLKLRELFELG